MPGLISIGSVLQGFSTEFTSPFTESDRAEWLSADSRVVGNPKILDLPLTALLTSLKVPPDLVLPSLELARSCRNDSVPVISGFQSPLEKELLRILLKGDQPIVICPAAELRVSVPRDWKGPLDSGRLLVLSPFTRRGRATAESAMLRNRMVASLSTRLMVIHARAGSRTYKVVSECIAGGTQTYCLEHPRNFDLVLLGAVPLPTVARPHVSLAYRR
jgi:predicted Rossmann fold nucleotide-binding protein DprA/Smf involved in DNA uptake